MGSLIDRTSLNVFRHWSEKFAINESRIEDQFCPIIRDLGLPPTVYLALHRLKVPLDPVHTDRQGVNEIEALAMLSQDRREITAERPVRAAASCK